MEDRSKLSHYNCNFSLVCLLNTHLITTSFYSCICDCYVAYPSWLPFNVSIVVFAKSYTFFVIPLATLPGTSTLVLYIIKANEY